MSKPNDAEREEILAALPRHEWMPPDGEFNAYVYIDEHGRLCILPIGGGWLGIEPSDFHIVGADIAPFSD